MTTLEIDDPVEGVVDALSRVNPWRRGGLVRSCRAGTLLASGLTSEVGIGDVCAVEIACGSTGAGGGTLLGEVVAFDAQGVTLMPYGPLDGIAAGARLWREPGLTELRPDLSWRGRVVDAMAAPADGGPPLRPGPRAYGIKGVIVPAGARRELGPRLHLGVRALDLFTPCRQGQRMGIFAGSGVGKSTLLSMIARSCEADVLVIGLIGERGRELNEFLTHTLGQEGRARSVVVAATSDEPAMLRRRAALLTLTIAEAFRDAGLRVLCLMDSVTRYAMALREIFLAAGEVPTSRGYPPGVFAELPRLLERAGPGAGEGSITGLFTVLVEGDDTNEPIADTVRGILDGHVMLERSIAEGGRFPAVDVLKSLSRTAPGCYAPDERPLARAARAALRLHADMAEMIQLGAYRPGSNAEVDRAIQLRTQIEELLRQEVDEPQGEAAFGRLAAILAEMP